MIQSLARFLLNRFVADYKRESQNSDLQQVCSLPLVRPVGTGVQEVALTIAKIFQTGWNSFIRCTACRKESSKSEVSLVNELAYTTTPVSYQTEIMIAGGP